jgi:hypothetical protein
MTRTLARSAAALAVAAVAACGDAPSAPATPEAPSAAIQVGPGRVQYHVTYAVLAGGGAGNMLSGTSAMFEASGGHQKEVFDNKEGDLDARVGYYRVAMPFAASYKAGLRTTPFPYHPYGSIREKARTGTTTDLGMVGVAQRPRLRVHIRNKDGLGVIPGATITVTGGGSTQVIADNSQWDYQAQVPGVIDLYAPMSGSYQICETTVPPGFFAPSPICQTVDAKWSSYAEAYFLHEQVFSDI